MVRTKFTTPTGILSYPCFIDEADASYVDENKENDLGDYKVRLRLDPEDAEAAEFLATLQDIYDTNLEEFKVKLGKKKIKSKEEGKPWMKELDTEGNETGMMLVRAKMTSRVTKKNGEFFDQSPKVFDMDGKLLSEVPRVGPGTEAKVAGEIYGWYNGGLGVGITLRLQAVQVLKFVEKMAYGGNNATDYGFAVQEFDEVAGSHDF